MVRLHDCNEAYAARMFRQVEQLRTLAREVCSQCYEVLGTGIPESLPILLKVTIEARQDHPWSGVPRVTCSLHEVED